MSLRRIKHTLLRMSAEEKVIGIGSTMMLIGVFMPWYSVVMNFEKNSVSETGFSGDLGVIGFIIFIMSLLSLLVLIAENMHIPLPNIGYKREGILFFLLGQSGFLTLLSVAIYTKKSLDFTDASLRFGIYLVLIGGFFGALSAFALIQKKRKEEAVELFQHDDDEGGGAAHETPEEVATQEPEPMYFEEDLNVIDEAISTEADNSSGYIAEDDMIEDIQEVPSNPSNIKNQANYFNKEAGINKEDTATPKAEGLGSSFYNDK